MIDRYSAAKPAHFIDITLNELISSFYKHFHCVSCLFNPFNRHDGNCLGIPIHNRELIDNFSYDCLVKNVCFRRLVCSLSFINTLMVVALMNCL